MQKTCGAPGCANLTAQATGKGARQINGIQLCRSCYQRIWALSKNTGAVMDQLMREGVPPPKRPLPRIATICAREGCNVKLPKNAGAYERRTIGLNHVCNACYQVAWEQTTKKDVSLEQAFRELKPKFWRPAPPRKVRCCIPWCTTEFVPQPADLIHEDMHTCGSCRGRFKALARGEAHKCHDWRVLAVDAIKGIIAAPGSPEPCAMPWCNRSEKPRRRGPAGEVLCNSDAMYLYMYARRHKTTFEKAFREAPAPRLLHTRS